MSGEELVDVRKMVIFGGCVQTVRRGRRRGSIFPQVMVKSLKLCVQFLWTCKCPASEEIVDGGDVDKCNRRFLSSCGGRYTQANEEIDEIVTTGERIQCTVFLVLQVMKTETLVERA